MVASHENSPAPRKPCPEVDTPVHSVDCDQRLLRCFSVFGLLSQASLSNLLACVADTTIAKALNLVNDVATVEVMNMSSNTTPSIGIVGGTGDLAVACPAFSQSRQCAGGFQKPSRRLKRPRRLRRSCQSALHTSLLRGWTTCAAERGDIVFVTVLWRAHPHVGEH